MFDRNMWRAVSKRSLQTSSHAREASGIHVWGAHALERPKIFSQANKAIEDEFIFYFY